MSYRRAYLLLGGLALAGCPDPVATTDTAGTTADTGTTDLTGSTGTTQVEPTTAAPTSEPTTGDSTTGDSTTGDPTTGGSTTGDSTTGDAEVGPARVLYSVAGESPGQPRALRAVEIAGGVASAPSTLLTAPEGGALGYMTFDATGRWATIGGHDLERDRLWLLDLETLTIEEIAFPPGVLAIGEPAFSGDGSRMAVSGGVPDGQYDLYVCTLAGGCAPALFSPPMPPMASVDGLGGHVFSPSNERIAFSVHAAGGGSELWIGALDQPGEATMLAKYPAITTDFSVRMFSADEKTLYYSADIAKNSQYEYFAVDLQSDPPGEPIPLSPPVVADARGRLAPDASALLWWTGEDFRGDLHYIPVSGAVAGDPVLINAEAPGRVFYGRFEWSDDAERVAYLSDQDLVDVDALYVTAIADGPGAPVEVSGPLAAGGGVKYHHFTTDPDRMVYFAFPGEQLGLEMFLARVDAPGEVVTINAPLPAGGQLLGSFGVSSDLTRMIYAGEQEVADVHELFYVELVDGQPSPPIKLNDPLPTDGTFGYDIDLSDDGERVFYTAEVAPDTRALYTVAIGANGPESPVQLSAPDDPVAWSLALPPAP